MVPEKFVGLQVKDLNLKKDFNLELIAVARAENTTNILGFSVSRHNNDVADNIEYMIARDDELVCYGKDSDFRSLWSFIG